MTTFLQMLTALFAVIGLFETVWQVLLFFARHKTAGMPIQIIVPTHKESDPAFLTEDVRLLTNHLSAGSQPRIWLICNGGEPQEKICRYVANSHDNVRVVSPQNLAEEVRAFAENL